MAHQGNMITAQGRDDPNQNTGISVHASRVRPAPDFESVKSSFRTYLGLRNFGALFFLTNKIQIKTALIYLSVEYIAN